MLTGVDDLVVDDGWGSDQGQSGYAGALEGSSGGALPAGPSGDGGEGGMRSPGDGDDDGSSAGGEIGSDGIGSGGSSAGGSEGAGGEGSGGEATGDGGTSGGGTSGGGGGADSGGSSAGGSGGSGSGAASSGGSAGSGGSGSGGSGSGGQPGKECPCTGGKVCEKKKCVCPDDELDCGATCVDGACCPGEVLGNCDRCGILVCDDSGDEAECTGQGVCEAGNTCGLLGVGEWDDGKTECNVCGLLEEAYCNESCEPDCRDVLGL